MDLDGRIVLITGAAHGIGRATAFAFGEKGAELFVTDIDEVGLEKTRAELEERGFGVGSNVVDVTREQEVTAMIESAISEMNGLDIVVSNAGVSVAGPAEAVPIEDWRWIVDVNVWPHVYAVRAALPYFREKGSGYLVHVASAAGILGAPALSAYSLTKFAVYGLAESLAVSLHGTGIGISVVCPLWVNTDITERGRITVDPDIGMDEGSARAFGREMLRSSGIPPEQVGEAIVNGVLENRFLILPHPEVLQFAQIKWADPESYIARASEALQSQRRLFGESSGAPTTN